MFSFTTPAWESNDSGDKWHKEVFEGKKGSKGKVPLRKGKESNKITKPTQVQKNKNNNVEGKITDKVRKKSKQRGNKGRSPEKANFTLKKSNKVAPFPQKKQEIIKKQDKLRETREFKHKAKQPQNKDKILNKIAKIQPAKGTANNSQETRIPSTGSTKIDIYNLGVSKKNKLKMSLRERMMEKLKSSRFRYLNEQIYTTDGKSACDLFKNDRDAFLAYHDGYKQQASKWPLNPLDNIIKSISKMPADRIIADMGCGDAILAASVPQKVHSFDLVAVNERVTESEMSNVPLDKGSVDVVVFCLSLMGTNIQDFIYEANRILKDGGILKIAEVESRFEKVETFIKGVEHFGFKYIWKDLSQKLFYFIDFKKVCNCKQKSKLPSISLLPCMYKKR